MNLDVTGYSPKIVASKRLTLDKLLFYGILLILCFVPLMVRTSIVSQISPTISATSMDTGRYTDAFNNVRFWFLLVVTCGLFIVFLSRVQLYGIKRIYTDPYCYALFILFTLSSTLSPYKSASIFGHFIWRQGTLSYIVYLSLFLMCSHLAYSENDQRRLIQSLYIFPVVNFFLAITDFYGRSQFSVRATLGNPDYLSGFSAMLAMLFLIQAIFARDGWQRVINLTASILSVSLVFISLATSGFFTILACSIVVGCAIYLHPQKIKALSTLLIFIALSAGILFTLSNHNKQVLNESIGLIGQVVFQERNGGKEAIRVSISEPPDSEFYLPPNGTSPGNGRFYIWKNTVELIKERPIQGYGLDTLAYFFPQWNLDRKSQFGYLDGIIDIPHNMYLGIAFGSGLLTLLIFLAMVLQHLYKHTYALYKHRGQRDLGNSLSLLIAVVAYLTQALVNDPVIGSAPVFWILLGVNVSIVNTKLNDPSPN